MGAKLVSLVDKASGREWILPPSDKPFVPAGYGSVFTDQDMSGWDEMFPTIDECAYPLSGAYRDALMPDHGEVWALPWDVLGTGADAIHLAVRGRALPYRLSRTISFDDARTLRLAYAVKNTGSAPLVGLWAAHPQFQLQANTFIQLPDSVSEVMNVYRTRELGEVGQRHTWSWAQSHDGKDVALDRVDSLALSAARKYYLLPDQPVSWAMLRDGERGSWLRLSWDAAQVPYLGVWMDNGQINSTPTIALEPATGFYDNLVLAYENKRIPVFQPGETRSWELIVSLGS
jgi:galactose mutarotase-like enzyme